MQFMKGWAATGTLLALGIAAPAGAAVEERVALLPVVAVNADPANAERMTRALQANLRLQCLLLMFTGAIVIIAADRRITGWLESLWRDAGAALGVLSWDQHQQRYARGAACMKMYGYKI